METCVHHWLIESRAINGTFPARCTLCAARRTFPVIDWERSVNAWGTHKQPAHSAEAESA